MGGRHIDTANDYKDQVAIGQMLTNYGLPREELFITTKCPGTIGYEATVQCVDDNMQMLNLFTDQGKAVNGYIDLLLVHFPFKTPLACRFRDVDTCGGDPAFVAGSAIMGTLGPSPPEEKAAVQSTWRALEDMKKLGVLKSIGVSSFGLQQLQWILDIATEPIDVNQVNWNPLVHNDAVLEFCRRRGIQLEAFSPLGGSAQFNQRFGIEGSLFTYPLIKDIADRHGVSAAQVILRWSLQQGVAVATSSNDPAHQKLDMKMWGFALDGAEMEAISRIATKPCAADADCSGEAPVCLGGTCAASAGLSSELAVAPAAARAQAGAFVMFTIAAAALAAAAGSCGRPPHRGRDAAPYMPLA